MDHMNNMNPMNILCYIIVSTSYKHSVELLLYLGEKIKCATNVDGDTHLFKSKAPATFFWYSYL